MATTPTVEMALGGSLRALAGTHGFGYLAGVARLGRVLIGGNWVNGIPLTGATGSWVTAARTELQTTSIPATAASVLPEGGVSLTANGTTVYFSRNTTGTDFALWGDYGILPVSLETVITLNALPSAGQTPTIWGSDQFGLQYRDDGKVHAVYNSSSVASATVGTGSAVHLVLTRSGASPDAITLYVNGVSTSATPARVSLSGSIIYAGLHSGSSSLLSATYHYLAMFAGELSSADVSAHYATLAWTDVTNDTLGHEGLSYERGIRDDRPSNRVASTGTLSFSMNNLASNSGGVTGYYSPGHASCRTGFGKGTPVRVKTGSDIQFVGRIRAIAPAPGKTGGWTKVVATDFIDQAATFFLDNVPALTNTTGDAVFSQVVSQMTNQPVGLTAYPGTETYTVALDNTRNESVSALAEFHRLAISELGYIYVTRTGELVYAARGTRMANNPSATVTLADTMHGIDVAEVSSSTINRVQVTTHPREIDSAATTVLFALTNALEIAPGETKTIIGPYRTASSPGITTRIGGLEMVTPVATTDYTMNVESDGTGADLTGSLSIVTNFGANGVQFVLTSQATETAYITKLQCRGKGVYDFRTVVLKAQNDAAVAADGVNALNLDMVYQENPNVGQSVADALLATYGDLSGTRVRRVEVYPDAAGSPAGIITNDISDRVAVSETVTGATGEYYINGVKHEFKNGSLAKITWWLTPAEPLSYWILGVAGASELGTSTVLAPG